LQTVDQTGLEKRRFT